MGQGRPEEDKDSWQEMIGKSWSPQQWFEDEGRPVVSCEESKGSIMWVYRETQSGVWTVGFYSPDKVWNPETDWRTAEEAAARVRWLNGGGQ